jgi:hypothetical protein
MIGWHEADANKKKEARKWVFLNGRNVTGRTHRFRVWGLPFLGWGRVWLYDVGKDGRFSSPLTSTIRRGVVLWVRKITR